MEKISFLQLSILKITFHPQIHKLVFDLPISNNNHSTLTRGLLSYQMIQLEIALSQIKFREADYHLFPSLVSTTFTQILKDKKYVDNTIYIYFSKELTFCSVIRLYIFGQKTSMYEFNDFKLFLNR